METRLDFMQLLEADMALNILACLDDASDLIRASSVSRFWRDFVIVNGLCKQLCLRIFPQLANVARVIEPSCKIKKPVDVGSSNSVEWEALYREHRVYGSLFKALTSVKVVNCLVDAISASSTDNYPEESIVYTLDPRDKILQRPSYWSSKGHKNPEVPETLIYKLRDDLCVVTEINVRPFQAYFQPGQPIYSAKSVRFRMGQPKFPTEMNSDLMELPLQRRADEKFIWTYTSQEFPMSQENLLQNFKLSEPVLCIGGFLQIELLGRVQIQEMDGLFYLCVSHVQVMGRPLFPAFGVHMFEPTGKFTLKYSAEAFPRTLQNDSPPNPSSLPEEERVWGHFEGLVEFLMQRNEPGGLPFELEDEDEDDIEWNLL